MFTKKIGIDLGTANSLVYLAGTGIVLNEPTVVAVMLEDNRVMAVGKEAREMLGRTPGTIAATRPMKDGVIADYTVTEAMLRYFIEKACGRSFLFKPEVMIAVPAGVTQVEERAVQDAALSAGARAVYLISEPFAAAIGANIPVAEPSGNMIVDIGGGSTEAAIISLGGMVIHRSVRVGGTKIDEAIAAYLKKHFNLLIGERTAEEIKIRIGDALVGKWEMGKEKWEVGNGKREKGGGKREVGSGRGEVEKGKKAVGSGGKGEEEMEVRGRDALSGLPRLVQLNAHEVSQAIQEPLSEIVSCVKATLEESPPELSSDIIDKGIILSGGTSLLRNLDKLLRQETGVSIHLAEEPLLCVAKGTGVALENLEVYKRSISRR